MDITLLGSGEAVGVPAPLCGCRYCAQSPRRRRPSLLIETNQSTVVLDASPELKEQLHETGTTEVDAFCLTHHHYDHVGGLYELNHAAMGFDAHVGIDEEYIPADTFEDAEKPRDPEFSIYLTETALGHLTDSTPHLAEQFPLHTITHDDVLNIGDLRIVPFPVDHARSRFDTLGFTVYHNGKKLVYAPDMWEFMDDTEYKNADLLFVEGAALFRAFGHGEKADLRAALTDADAERTILLNVNEHLQRMTTDELRRAAERDGYELSEDFETYNL